MRTVALIVLLCAVLAMFGLPAIEACGGMTILPPPPASDPDVPDLPSDDASDYYNEANDDWTGSDRDGDGDVDADDIYDYDDGTFTEAVL